jgi:LPXTG-motif cell wall-anchored protein
LPVATEQLPANNGSSGSGNNNIRMIVFAIIGLLAIYFLTKKRK